MRAFAMRVGPVQARADQHDHIRLAESHRTSGRRQAFGGRQQVERA